MFFLHERISEYIRINVFVRMNIRFIRFKKSGTNEGPNKYLCQNYSNISQADDSTDSSDDDE